MKSRVPLALTIALFILLPVAQVMADSLVAAPPPAFSKSFAPSTVEVGAASTLTFTFDNTASGLEAAGLDFTDNLPAGMVVATPPNASTTCTGGTITAVAGSGVIAYTGGTVAAGATCTVQADVVVAAEGSYNNTTGDATSRNGNSGPANASLQAMVSPPIPTLSGLMLISLALIIAVAAVRKLNG